MSEPAAIAPVPASDVHPKPVPPPQGLAPGSVADWLAWGERELEASSDSPRADAGLLLAALLGCERSTLSARAEDSLEAATVLAYASRIERRRLGEPVAYITARAGFWTLDLVVDTRVLIPRPDTEALVEWALAILAAHHPREAGAPRIADLGTGSGAIALALAEARPDALIVATDLSNDALEIARLNAHQQAAGNVEILHGAWLDPLAQRGETFDLIVSNPPYIAEGDAHLAALRFEPRLALTSGPDGLEALRTIIREAPPRLRAGGWLLLEHGHDQAAAVRELLAAAGFVDIATRRDFGGNERVSGGCWR